MKRTREEGSSSAMDTADEIFEINCRKRPKINPVTEQEETVGIMEITNTDTMVRKRKSPAVLEETHQLSTSNTQLIKK